jgi:hypothetical protein
MPFYQCIFHGQRFHIDCDDGDRPICGFYSGRKTFAPDETSAHTKLLKTFRSEERVEAMMEQSREVGADPYVRITKLFEITLWGYLFGSCPRGFIFYDDSPDGTSEDSHENED